MEPIAVKNALPSSSLLCWPAAASRRLAGTVAHPRQNMVDLATEGADDGKRAVETRERNQHAVVTETFLGLLSDLIYFRLIN